MLFMYGVFSKKQISLVAVMLALILMLPSLAFSTDSSNQEVFTVTDESGVNYTVTITPPSDKTVDVRLIEDIKQSLKEANSVESSEVNVPEKKSKKEVSKKAIDVSGYSVQIDIDTDRVTCSSCKSFNNFPKSYSSLEGGKTFTYTITGSPEYAHASVYPLNDDVDVKVYSGTSVCASSNRIEEYLDYAGCYSSSCSYTGTIKIEFKNPGTSKATYQYAIGWFNVC